jgi:hypothetical protein
LAGCLGLLTACGSPAITVTPDRLAFGEVDFTRDVPSGGFAATTLVMRNAGSGAPEVTLVGFPFDWLCAEGFSGAPADVGSLGNDEELRFTVGVCAYDAEQGTGVERSGTVDFDIDGTRTTVPWTFTPTNDLSGGSDSGW